MSIVTAARASVTDDERSLLVRLEALLEREGELLVAHDDTTAVALVALAEERERVAARLGEAARIRRASGASDASEDAELMASYRRLRQRHDVRAQVLRRHADRNARAVGVLAQASGQDGLYRADGRIAMHFVPA